MKPVVTLLVVASLALAQPLRTGAGTYEGFSDSTSSTATFAAASSFGAACPPQTTVVANRDATIDQSLPAKNFGSAASLTVRSGAGQVARSLVGFNLPVTGGCQVVTAELRMYPETGQAGRLLAATRLSSAWTESSVTWNSRPSEAGEVAAATLPAGGWLTFNVTGQVRDMYRLGNNGLVVTDATETGGTRIETFTAINSGKTFQLPQLVLTFG